MSWIVTDLVVLAPFILMAVSGTVGVLLLGLLVASRRRARMRAGAGQDAS